MNIKTWQEEAKEWPDHRRGLATNQMIWMQQEIDELRAAYEAQKQRAYVLALAINDLTRMVTYEGETKEDFIKRVKSILSVNPDLRVCELQKENAAQAKLLDYEIFKRAEYELECAVQAKRIECLELESAERNKRLAWLEKTNEAQAKRITELEAAKPKMAPVQGYVQGIPWDMHLEAYNAYCKKYGAQQALIEGGCRGGFGVRELDMFIPGWREKLSLVGRLNAEIEALRKQVETAVNRIHDLLQDDDGQAHKEARKFIESLSAQKGAE